jgi:hypothetical protein
MVRVMANQNDTFDIQDLDLSPVPKPSWSPEGPSLLLEGDNLELMNVFTRGLFHTVLPRPTLQHGSNSTAHKLHRDKVE